MTAAAPWRNKPFNRDSVSPNTVSNVGPSRPMSAILTPPSGTLSPTSHARNHSFSPLSGSNIAPARPSRQRSNSSRSSNQMSNTFAPKFIKTEEAQCKNEDTGGIEGEHDFSGKRYVWLRDPETAFVKGWIVEELENGRILVQCDDGSVEAPTIILFIASRKLMCCSNGKPTEKMWTKSTLRSLTRQTIWRS